MGRGICIIRSMEIEITITQLINGRFRLIAGGDAPGMIVHGGSPAECVAHFNDAVEGWNILFPERPWGLS